MRSVKLQFRSAPESSCCYRMLCNVKKNRNMLNFSRRKVTVFENVCSVMAL